MDSNTEAAIICVSALASLGSSLILAAILFGLCSMPSVEMPSCCSCNRGGDEDDWCLTLALRWFCYKYCCCCCGSRNRVQDWLKEDLRKLEVSSKFGPYCCQAALQHVVVPENVKPVKCSKKAIVLCDECGERVVCEKHEEWKQKTACECIKEMSSE